MTENKRFNDFRGYKRFDTYFDDCMQLWTVSDNENDNILYPCTSENMANEFAKLLNEFNDEKEKWKSASLTASSENSILWNEIHILMEQGVEPSDAFKKYLESISTKHTKFWQRKLEKAKKDGVIE